MALVTINNVDSDLVLNWMVTKSIIGSIPDKPTHVTPEHCINTKLPFILWREEAGRPSPVIVNSYSHSGLRLSITTRSGALIEFSTTYSEYFLSREEVEANISRKNLLDKLEKRNLSDYANSWGLSGPLLVDKNISVQHIDDYTYKAVRIYGCSNDTNFVGHGSTYIKAGLKLYVQLSWNSETMEVPADILDS